MFDCGEIPFLRQLSVIPTAWNFVFDVFKRSSGSSKWYCRDEIFKCINENCDFVVSGL